MTEEYFFTNDKYSEFISDYEDKWLQFASIQDRMKAYFGGDLNNAIELYKKWKKGEDLWQEEKLKFWFQGGIGGANTKTGLAFEGKVDLITFLTKQKGYSSEDNLIYYKGELVAQVFKKYNFYKFLDSRGVKWKEIISKKLLPDDSIFVIIKNTLYIIECKFQKVAGSVDEKLQTCDFKRKQYRKLLAPLNIDVEYIYLLSDWFMKKEYQDVLNYIIDVNCYYYFNYIPLEKIGLPVPEVG